MLANLAKCRSALGTATYAQAASIPKITYKKFESPQEEHHDIRNAKLNRPLSPHLTIYKFPFPSVLSITHRTTGILNLYLFSLSFLTTVYICLNLIFYLF